MKVRNERRNLHRWHSWRHQDLIFNWMSFEVLMLRPERWWTILV